MTAEAVSNNTSSTLAPWIEQQALALLQQRSHAWLLQGPSGLGQQALGMALVRAWLCEQPQANGLACNACPSCHAIDARTHADLHVLMPEVHALEQGWPVDEKAQKEIHEKKRKPSKEIRIEAMRTAIEFAQRTSSRNLGKAVLIYPAERMNTVTANALLKTLEEPAGNTRFVLASEAAHLLLPTIRSRCLLHTMHWPACEDAQHWLQEQGLGQEDASVLLVAAGARPQDALDLAHQGIHASQWKGLPRAALTGQSSAFATFSPAQTIAVLEKICHDLLAIKAGGAPRFFAIEDLPRPQNLQDWATLTAWAKNLFRSTRTAEHPYMPALLLEDLLSQASCMLHKTANRRSAA